MTVSTPDKPASTKRWLNPRRIAIVIVLTIALALFGLSVAAYLYRRPMVMLWLLSAAALASLWYKRQDRRRRLWVLTIAFTVLTIYYLPATSYLLCLSLESRHPPLGRRPPDIDAIVVLAGGLRSPEAEGLPFQLAEDTLYRCLRAVEMYRTGARCPVVVSGGRVDPESTDPSFASVMKDYLVSNGVDAADIIEEATSHSTHENAVHSARLLRENGIQKILLVTDGMHLDRALRCFQKEGITVVPCGCRYRTLEFEWALREFMPSPAAAQDMRAALYEHMAVLWYTRKGWI